MINDLLRSSKFDSLDNLCVNKSEEVRFSKFIPTKADDFTEIMAKKWAQKTFNSLEDFNPLTDFFLPLILYTDNKKGTKQTRTCQECYNERRELPITLRHQAINMLQLCFFKPRTKNKNLVRDNFLPPKKKEH